MKKFRIGLIREGKVPEDYRVALTPRQCKKLLRTYPNIEIYIQPSKYRSYSAQEYSAVGIHVREELRNCDILLGIKEVPVSQLISGKTYMFFSHTTKKQPHNKELLRQIMIKKNDLIDLELLTDAVGERLVGFGRFAGIVGAHNGLVVWGNRTKQYSLKRAKDCKNFYELEDIYEGFQPPPVKIAVTGDGRVAQGVWEMMELAGIREVSVEEFLGKEHFDEAVFVKLHAQDMYKHKEGTPFDKEEFYNFPEKYESNFRRFLSQTDLLMNAIYWNPKADKYFSKDDMRQDDFRIQVIADISCDINGPIPATIKSSTIENFVYGYDPEKETITQPYQEQCIDVMAVDNLPNELPRDASEDFARQMVDNVIGYLLNEQEGDVIERATIVRGGELTDHYKYLEEFVNT